jgi:ferritin-like metal-binding protein YciE
MGGKGTFGPGIRGDPIPVAELDGVWDVRRLSGVLPPMYGVRKRIGATRGETIVGPVRMSFEVRGNELHYRAPLSGFVDVLEGEGDVLNGRATFNGKEYARFELRRVAMATEEGLHTQLVKHVDEALAMEQNVLRMLDGMIATTDDPEIKEKLRQHKAETETHSDRMQSRLDALGAQPSVVREAGGVLGALMKSVVDLARGEKAGRNARDGYATEHMEIAAYQLLERIAERAGDTETAEAARLNRADEERMAQEIDAKWDRFAELSLKEEGVAV